MGVRTALYATLVLMLAARLEAQACVNISTGFDSSAGAVIGGPLDELEDDDYTIDSLDGSILGLPAVTVVEDGFPIPPWIPNDGRSRWIGFSGPDSEAAPGTYLYTIVFELPAEIDAPKATLVGAWASDDGGTDVIINGVSTRLRSNGFGAFTEFSANFGLGLFTAGENALTFVVDNGGGPAGLRVDACVGVPVVSDRLVDLSTGFDESRRLLLGDLAADDDWTITGPAGSGISGAAVCVADDGFPIPPWFPSSVQSRWVGPAAPGAVGPSGEYRFRITFDLPPAIAPALAALSGEFSSSGPILDILVNGASSGLVGSGNATRLEPFPVVAAQGLFRALGNTVEFVLAQGSEGPVGLRLDGEVLQGHPPAATVPARLFLDTGFDDGGGVLLGNDALDDNYAVTGPPGSALGPVRATTVAADGYPIPPWVVNSPISRWIGVPRADSDGPPGTYSYVVETILPSGVLASEARLVGGWATDDNVEALLINGVATGIVPGPFGELTPFPQDAGKGLFREGSNRVEFRVVNAGGPTGLRVEAVVGFEQPRPGDLSTGLEPRGVGLLPEGIEDTRYHVTGPEGSGIGRQRAVVVHADGSPIPPWAPNSAGSRWIGLDGDATTGPAGTYVYELRFQVPAGANPYRFVLEGAWAAAGAGGDVLLNDERLGITAPGSGALTPFPARAGLGLFVAGENVLQFEVNNMAAGATGLRVEASLEVVVEPNPLDISTGLDQRTGQPIFEGDPDDDYLVTDLLAGTNPASVLIGAPVPPWAPQASSSRWIGAFAASVPPGPYSFEVQVELESEDAAAEARIVGVWAVDNEAVALSINDMATGVVNTTGFGVLVPFPADTGKGLFGPGTNVIRFEIVNAGNPGEPDNPMGLRVDAVVATGRGLPEGVRFHRGDVDQNGQLQLTDAVRILGYLFLGGIAPDCFDVADADDNGQLQLTDAVRILGFLFLGGVAPAPPGPPPQGCDVDPSDEQPPLGCVSYSGC